MYKIALASRSVVLLAFLFLSACASMQVAREVQSGRAALRVSNPKAAIPHFEEAARLNPAYITDFTPLKIGIWTYIGRAQYEAGNTAKALENLKRAKQQYPLDDHVASLYLGLAMTQNGGRSQAAKEIESGLRGLHTWLETLPGRSLEGRYWDPGSYLRRTMSETLIMLQEKEPDWKEIAENVKWIGQKLDEEIEEVRKQRDRDAEDNGKQDGGFSTGGP